MVRPISTRSTSRKTVLVPGSPSPRLLSDHTLSLQTVTTVIEKVHKVVLIFSTELSGEIKDLKKKVQKVVKISLSVPTRLTAAVQAKRFEVVRVSR